jgi:hypothetical protein
MMVGKLLGSDKLIVLHFNYSRNEKYLVFGRNRATRQQSSVNSQQASGSQRRLPSPSLSQAKHSPQGATSTPQQQVSYPSSQRPQH